jgi:hypothetical protein
VQVSILFDIAIARFETNGLPVDPRNGDADNPRDFTVIARRVSVPPSCRFRAINGSECPTRLPAGPRSAAAHSPARPLSGRYRSTRTHFAVPCYNPSEWTKPFFTEIVTLSWGLKMH